MATILVALAIVAGIVIACLSLLGGPEWIQSMVVLALFTTTLIGAYWFLLVPQRRLEEPEVDVRE